MLYNVIVSKNEKFRNPLGMEMTEEVEVERIKRKTSKSAEKTALKLVEKYEDMDGEYEVIVHYLHHDSPCYLNPVGGHSPVGENWL